MGSLQERHDDEELEEVRRARAERRELQVQVSTRLYWLPQDYVMDERLSTADLRRLLENHWCRICSRVFRFHTGLLAHNEQEHRE